MSRVWIATFHEGIGATASEIAVDAILLAVFAIWIVMVPIWIAHDATEIVKTASWMQNAAIQLATTPCRSQ